MRIWWFKTALEENMARVGLTREGVIQSAIELVAEEGYANLSICNLANRLGVKPASLYNHIDSLEDVAISVGNQAVILLNDRLHRDTHGSTPEERLHAFANAYRAFFQENPELAVALTSAARYNTPSVDLHRTIIDRAYNDVLKEFGLSWQQIVHCRRTLKALLHGFCNQVSVQRYSHPLVWIDQSFDFMVDLFISGIYAMKDRETPAQSGGPDSSI